MYADGLVVENSITKAHMHTHTHKCKCLCSQCFAEVVGLPSVWRDIKISGHNTQPSILQYMAIIKRLCGLGTINEGEN